MKCIGLQSCVCRKCLVAYEKMKSDNKREFDRLAGNETDEVKPWMVTHRMFRSIGDYLFGPRKS